MCSTWDASVLPGLKTAQEEVFAFPQVVQSTSSLSLDHFSRFAARQKKILIFHEDLPLKEFKKDRAIYIHILSDVQSSTLQDNPYKADLVAHPISRYVLKKDQPNKALFIEKLQLLVTLRTFDWLNLSEELSRVSLSAG